MPAKKEYLLKILSSGGRYKKYHNWSDSQLQKLKLVDLRNLYTLIYQSNK